MTGNPNNQRGTAPIDRVPTQDELSAAVLASDRNSRGHVPYDVGPQQAPYGQRRSPRETGPQRPAPTPTTAIVGFAIGVMSICASLLFVPGLVAVALSVKGLRQSKEARSLLGRNLAIAGISTSVFSLVLGAGIAVALQALPDDATVVVERVIDGDTIDVVNDGKTVRIRLLNVDAPETKHPDEPAECLGPEAAAFLKATLPSGTAVQLRYDVERTDKYDRTLAGVFLTDGTFVNAEIARAGFGNAVVFEPNRKFYQQVLDAEGEARAAEKGLFSTTVNCTPVARTQQYEDKTVTLLHDGAPGHDPSLTAIDTYLKKIAKQIQHGKKLVDGLEDEQLADKATHQLDQLRDAKKDWTQKRKQIKAERQAAQEAKEAAEREAAEREAAERAEAESSSSEGSSDSSTSTGSRGTSTGGTSGSGSTDTDDSSSSGMHDPSYTGCRAYRDTGRWLDDQGRNYDKIDCTTKQIIG